MAQVQEMFRGELRAAPVIDHDDIDIRQAGFTIQVDHYCTGLLEGAQKIQIRSG